jgi:hypothetical protein
MWSQLLVDLTWPQGYAMNFMAPEGCEVVSMNELEAKVLQETERFFSALPDLIESLGGRWVVFLDGQVVSHHDTEDAAYRDAVALFGGERGYVIAQVVEVTPTPITAGVMYGFSC